MNRRQFLAASAAVSISGVAAAKNVAWNVRDFGAAGDGAKLDTQAIQTAIDRCSGQGGGTVVIPPGRYLTGTLMLTSGVRLHLEEGAMLLGSTALGDYRLFEEFRDALGSPMG